MKVIYPINYHGYFPFLRTILRLVRENVLSLQQLGFYMCFVAQVDFDPRHALYRVIIRDDEQIGKEFGINPTTVYRHRKQLIKAGLFYEEDGYTKVTNYLMFELETVKKVVKSDAKNPETLFLIPQENIADIESFIANLQEEQGQNGYKDSNSNFSFKRNTSRDDLWLDKNE